MLLVGADVRRVDEALAGKGEAAGGVEQPVSAGIADAAARGADIIPFLDHFGARAGKRGDDRVRAEIVRKRQVGFDAEHQAGRHLNIVAALHAAGHAADDAVGRDRQRIGEHRGRRTAAVAGMAADVEAAPVERRTKIGRLERDIGRNCRAAERQRAERGAGQHVLQGSAVAVHRADIPGTAHAVVACHHCKFECLPPLNK